MAKQDFIAWRLILCSSCEIDLIWQLAGVPKWIGSPSEKIKNRHMSRDILNGLSCQQL